MHARDSSGLVREVPGRIQLGEIRPDLVGLGFAQVVKDCEGLSPARSGRMCSFNPEKREAEKLEHSRLAPEVPDLTPYHPCFPVLLGGFHEAPLVSVGLGEIVKNKGDPSMIADGPTDPQTPLQAPDGLIKPSQSPIHHAQVAEETTLSIRVADVVGDVECPFEAAECLE